MSDLTGVGSHIAGTRARLKPRPGCQSTCATGVLDENDGNSISVEFCGGVS